MEDQYIDDVQNTKTPKEAKPKGVSGGKTKAKLAAVSEKVK